FTRIFSPSFPNGTALENASDRSWLAGGGLRLTEPRSGGKPNLQQMIQGRAGGVAGAGEADGMHEHAGFHAEFGGDGFKRGFQRRRVEGREFVEGVAEFFEARFVFGHETFLRGFRLAGDFIAEIKPAVTREFAESFDFALA